MTLGQSGQRRNVGDGTGEGDRAEEHEVEEWWRQKGMVALAARELQREGRREIIRE